MKKNCVILLISSLLLFSNIRAQDASFSQYYSNPLNINPALTGHFDEVARAGISYRNQWAAVLVNPYETIGFEAEMKLKEGNEKSGPLAAGLSLLRDKAGASGFTITRASLSLSYIQQLGRRQFLGAGIQAGLGQYNMNYSELFWGNQYNPATNEFDATLATGEPNIRNKFSYSSVSAGLNYAYKSADFKRKRNEGFMFNLGGSFCQNIIPKNSFYDNAKTHISGRYLVHSDAYIGLSAYHLGIVPRIFFASHAGLNEIVAGAALNYRAQKESAAFNFGLYHRLNDAFIPYIGLEFSGFTLGFSYDAGTGALSKDVKNTNGLELNLMWHLGSEKLSPLF